MAFKNFMHVQWLGIEPVGPARATIIERILLIIGALALVYPSAMSDVLGFACVILVIVMQKMRKEAGTASGQPSAIS